MGRFPGATVRIAVAELARAAVASTP
jgi:hypothetical protein